MNIMDPNLTPEQKILLGIKDSIDSAIYNEENMSDLTKEGLYTSIGMIMALVTMKSKEKEVENEKV